jgi:hypothetical protein
VFLMVKSAKLWTETGAKEDSDSDHSLVVFFWKRGEMTGYEDYQDYDNYLEYDEYYDEPPRLNRRWLIVAVVVVAVLLCCCCLLVVAGAALLGGDFINQLDSAGVMRFLGGVTTLV